MSPSSSSSSSSAASSVMSAPSTHTEPQEEGTRREYSYEVIFKGFSNSLIPLSWEHTPFPNDSKPQSEEERTMMENDYSTFAREMLMKSDSEVGVQLAKSALEANFIITVWRTNFSNGSKETVEFLGCKEYNLSLYFKEEMSRGTHEALENAIDILMAEQELRAVQESGAVVWEWTTTALETTFSEHDIAEWFGVPLNSWFFEKECLAKFSYMIKTHQIREVSLVHDIYYKLFKKPDSRLNHLITLGSKTKFELALFESMPKCFNCKMKSIIGTRTETDLRLANDECDFREYALDDVGCEALFLSYFLLPDDTTERIQDASSPPPYEP